LAAVLILVLWGVGVPLAVEKKAAASDARPGSEYLAARQAEDAGDLGNAAENFSAVLHKDDELSPYAAIHLARVARSTGNLILEHLYLEDVLLRGGGSSPAAEAGSRIAENALERGDGAEAIRAIADLSRKGGSRAA